MAACFEWGREDHFQTEAGGSSSWNSSRTVLTAGEQAGKLLTELLINPTSTFIISMVSIALFTFLAYWCTGALPQTTNRHGAIQRRHS
jgi:hypothetical protein